MPVEGHGGSLCRVCGLIAIDTHLKAASGGSLLDTERSNAIGGVRRAVASTLFLKRPRTECWSYKTSRTGEKRKCFEHTLRRKEFATERW